MAEEVKKVTTWESLAWHFNSRKSRAAMVAILTIFLIKCKAVHTFLGIDPKDAASLANDILIVLGILITAMSGEKIMLNSCNGNGNGVGEGTIAKAISENNAKIEDVLISAVKTKIESKLHERMAKLEEEAHGILDKLEEKVTNDDH